MPNSTQTSDASSYPTLLCGGTNHPAQAHNLTAETWSRAALPSVTNSSKKVIGFYYFFFFLTFLSFIKQHIIFVVFINVMTASGPVPWLDCCVFVFTASFSRELSHYAKVASQTFNCPFESISFPLLSCWFLRRQTALLHIASLPLSPTKGEGWPTLPCATFLLCTSE